MRKYSPAPFFMFEELGPGHEVALRIDHRPHGRRQCHWRDGDAKGHLLLKDWRNERLERCDRPPLFEKGYRPGTAVGPENKGGSVGL